jgi:hypothetical protein
VPVLRPYLDPDQIVLDSRFPLSLDAPFTAAVARAQGVTRDDLLKLCRDGFLRQLVRGVYVAGHVPDSLDLRAQALKLVVPEDAVITDRTAGWLLGTDMALAPGDHLAVPPVSVYVNRRGGRLRNGLSDSGQRFLREDEVVEVLGLQVTSPLRTACDLGRLRNRDAAFAALTAIFALGHFTREELQDFTDRFRGMRHVIQLRSFVPIVDARAESFGEAVTHLRWRDTVSVVPDLQIEVERPGQWSLRIDIGVEELKQGIEYQGEKWHLLTDEQRERDEKRLSWLRDERDWLIDPVTKHNVFGRNRDIESIIVNGIRDARRRFRRTN